MEEAADELADFTMAVDSTVTKKNLVANLKVLKKTFNSKLNTVTVFLLSYCYILHWYALMPELSVL